MALLYQELNANSNSFSEVIAIGRIDSVGGEAKLEYGVLRGLSIYSCSIYSRASRLVGTGEDTTRNERVEEISMELIGRY